MGVSSLPKTVTRQRHGCDLHRGPSAPEPSHRLLEKKINLTQQNQTCNHKNKHKTQSCKMTWYDDKTCQQNAQIDKITLLNSADPRHASERNS